uniref:SFRICE_004163 n=1 Tax=Spodoptera frugiperda TaxID=7108 RepID=A0A2H1V6K8_SPOFR
MWKIVTLSAFLIVAQAAHIKDIYGDWIQAAFYGVGPSDRICLHFHFAELPEGPHCTYSDGSNATILSVGIGLKAGVYFPDRDPMALLAVDTPAEVMPALNLTAKCGDVVLRNNDVVRIVNKDYFILYRSNSHTTSFTQLKMEPNQAYLLGRKVVSSAELGKVMLSIEELKGRRGVQLCYT